jgi:iron complex transport system substrate-binding protein
MSTAHTNVRRTLLLGGASVAAVAAVAAIPAASARAQAPALRLVTLGGAVTECVYALGAQDALVGTDTTSLFPAAAQATRKVGYLRQLSAEGLLSLNPTAMVGSTDAGPPVVIDQVRSAGVNVQLVASDHTWGEVQRKVTAVGQVTQRQAAAAQLQRQLDAAWVQAQAMVARHTGRKPRVLFVLAHAQSPSVSGEGTAAEAVIQFMGGVNALSGFKGYRPMTAEAMAAAAPDVVLMTTQGLQAQGGEDKWWQRPELALTPAYRRKALVHLDALQLLGFGPRLPQTLELLHQRVVLA